MTGRAVDLPLNGPRGPTPRHRVKRCRPPGGRDTPNSRCNPVLESLPPGHQSMTERNQGRGPTDGEPAQHILHRLFPRRDVDPSARTSSGSAILRRCTPLVIGLSADCRRSRSTTSNLYCSELALIHEFRSLASGSLQLLGGRFAPGMC